MLKGQPVPCVRTEDAHCATHVGFERCAGFCAGAAAQLLLRLASLAAPHRPHASRCPLLPGGWAWGTPYAGVERENGIDELGYLSAEELLSEVRFLFLWL